jgi:uncharacterized protein with von Willebrand factor type A (vWA) domain
MADQDAQEPGPGSPPHAGQGGPRSGRRGLGGLIHIYQKYDPREFPSPSAPAPDIAGAALDHMLMFGSTRELTEEELARAVRIDPRMFPQLGPSLEALRAMLEERKRKILEKYETQNVQERASAAYRRQVGATRESASRTDLAAFDKAAAGEQIRDIERLWYKQRDESGEFARSLLRLVQRLGEKYQVEELAAKYDFTGREGMSVPKALEIKAELEQIDRLLEQLAEAMKNAQIGIIDLDEVESILGTEGAEQIEDLNRVQRQIEEYLRQQAEVQGLERTAQGYRLTPRAYAIFQGRLLSEIFSDLQAARSGRHQGPIIGEGPVELTRTKPYEFGDSVANMDIAQSFVNAMVRGGSDGVTERRSDEGKGSADPESVTVPLLPEDIVIHQTRNSPKCATAVLLDMSGSMRYGGQYINVKRMGLALDALIRREYPGDFLQFIELYSFATPRRASEIAAILPKPVSLNAPVVRLKVDMSNPDVSEMRIPQHFTNVQRGLQLARQFLGAQDTPNRQVILITDGLPTAHFEGSMLYLMYPPDPRTEGATMREAMLCARENITINIFLLPSWSQSHEDVQFANRMAEATKGRVFFTGGKDLDRYVLWDYVNRRRRIIA